MALNFGIFRTYVLVRSRPLPFSSPARALRLSNRIAQPAGTEDLASRRTARESPLMAVDGRRRAVRRDPAEGHENRKRPMEAAGLLLDGFSGCIGGRVGVPGQQLGDAVNRVVRDAAEDPS